ncbi:MAG: hypothetical protein AABY46_07865 [Nitrospirota bacterium]
MKTAARKLLSNLWIAGGIALVLSAAMLSSCGGGGGGDDGSTGPATSPLPIESPLIANSPILSGSSGTIATIAGTGAKATNQMDADSDGITDDPIPAMDAYFDLPLDMAAGPDGRIYLNDWNGHKVRALGSDGADNYVAFIIGAGLEGDACEDMNNDGQIDLNPDGSCVATSQQLNHATNIAFDSAGKMTVAGWHTSKIRQVDLAANKVFGICGTGDRKYVGEGIPCKDADGNDQVALDLPSGVVYDSNGNLFIADQANNIIRRIGAADGVIKTVAGNCPAENTSFGCYDGLGYDGDGGPATSAHLRNNVGQETDPQGKISMGPDGSLYIADTDNNVVRRVIPGSDGVIGDGPSSEEIITTVIGDGTGTAGYVGEGVPASTALLYGPRDIKVAPDGTIYIADTENNCIRKVSPGADGVVTGADDEIITTVAGRCGPDRAFAGDGGPAANAALNWPYGVELDAAGNLYIADTYNNRIRVVYK